MAINHAPWAVCHVADREILTVNAALGDRPMEHSGQWEQMPDGVGDPLSYPPRLQHSDWSGTINERLDQRMVKGRSYDDLALQELGEQSDGQYLLWTRIPDVIAGMDATRHRPPVQDVSPRWRTSNVSRERRLRR